MGRATWGFRPYHHGVNEHTIESQGMAKFLPYSATKVTERRTALPFNTVEQTRAAIDTTDGSGGQTHSLAHPLQRISQPVV